MPASTAQLGSRAISLDLTSRVAEPRYLSASKGHRCVLSFRHTHVTRIGQFGDVAAGAAAAHRERQTSLRIRDREFELDTGEAELQRPVDSGELVVGAVITAACLHAGTAPPRALPGTQAGRTLTRARDMRNSD